MRYVMARYTMEQRDLAYRIYVTDMMYLHGQNKTSLIRFEDQLKRKNADNRTGDEIADDVIKRAGLTLVNGE